MAVVLSGTGGVFKRVGHCAGGAADIVALMGGTATARVLSGASFQTRGTTLETDAAESPVISQTLDGHWAKITAWQAQQTSLLSQLAAIAQAEFIRQVDLDASLPTKDLTSAVKELIRQMVANSDSINASTVSAGSQTTVLATGNPVIVTTVKNAAGKILQTPYGEVIRFTVTADRNTPATSRQEPLSVKGQAAASGVYAYDWPRGSGASASITLVDAQSNNSGGTKLTNGAFETTTTTNVFDNWNYTVGSPTTNFAQGGSGNSYTQSGCLNFVGDGSTLTTLYQQFNTTSSTTANAGGTPSTLKPSTRYAVNAWVKAVGSPAAGVLRIALVDGSNAVVSDDAGTANSYTVNLATVGSTYTASSGVFITPTNLPTTLRLQLSLTTALSNTKNAYVDDLALTEMSQLYNGGPAVAAFAGATSVVLNDAWTVTISSSMGTLAAWLERFFSLRDKGLQFPYSGSPTVADSVVA